jgi:hypothetical protein
MAVDQARSPMPTTIKTTPVTTGQISAPGHDTPPRRPSTSAAMTAATKAGTKTKSLRSGAS